MFDSERWGCRCDHACFEPPEPEPLLLDTTFLSCLARISTHVASTAAHGAEDVFRLLVAALTCCGQRRLLLAEEQLAKEIEGGRRAPFMYAQLPEDIFRELFSTCHGVEPPEWEREHDGDTDRAILASAVTVGGPVTIVSLDESLVHWIQGKWQAGEIGHVTVMDGLELLARATACLALDDGLFSAALECELGFLEERVKDPSDGFTEARAARRRSSWRDLEDEVAWRLHRAQRQGGAAWRLG